MNIKVDPTEQLKPESMPERRTRSEGVNAQQKQTGGDDQVELSSRAQELSSIKEMAMNAPDIRTEKVNGIIKQVQEGSYVMDSRLIAERMIEEYLAE